MLERTDLANENHKYLMYDNATIAEQKRRLQFLDDRAKQEIGEERVTSPTGGSKGQKLARFDLLPWDVLEEVAKHYGRGALKYDERNWERGYDWSLSYAALQRHLTAFWCGEDYDPESSSHHLDAVIFHAMALRRFAKVKRYKQYDNRPNIQGE